MFWSASDDGMLDSKYVISSGVLYGMTASYCDACVSVVLPFGFVDENVLRPVMAFHVAALLLALLLFAVSPLDVSADFWNADLAVFRRPPLHTPYVDPGKTGSVFVPHELMSTAYAPIVMPPVEYPGTRVPLNADELADATDAIDKYGRTSPDTRVTRHTAIQNRKFACFALLRNVSTLTTSLSIITFFPFALLFFEDFLNIINILHERFSHHVVFLKKV